MLSIPLRQIKIANDFLTRENFVTLSILATKKPTKWDLKRQKQDELKCLTFAQNNYHCQEA